jgi:hypothetical protein
LLKHYYNKQKAIDEIHEYIKNDSAVFIVAALSARQPAKQAGRLKQTFIGLLNARVRKYRKGNP